MTDAITSQDAIAIIRELKTRTPDYAGEGPKPRHYQRIHATYDAAIAALEENEKLRRALEWYAEPVLPYTITQASEPRSAVHADGGKRAREALGIE